VFDDISSALVALRPTAVDHPDHYSPGPFAKVSNPTMGGDAISISGDQNVERL
jgi:hypothetical protein